MDWNNNKIYYYIIAVTIVTANYLRELLNCSVQKILNNSMISKHIALILLILLTVEYNNDYYKSANIYNKIFLIIRTYIGALLIMKLPVEYFISFISIFIIQYGLQMYIQDNSESKKATIINKEILENIENILQYVLYGIIVLGNIQYFRKQYREQKDFNIVKYIFGVIKCKNV